jgi:HEAT repeat protein
MLKRYHFVLFFLDFFLVQTFVFAQESILASYERNFLRSGIAEKERILRDAAADKRAPEFIGALHEFALNFVLQNMDVLQSDADFSALTLTVVRGIGLSGRRSAAESLWQVFSRFQDTLIRVEAVNILAVIGEGNAVIVENLNRYLIEQNNMSHSGISVEYPVLSACIKALGALGEGSSFPALFPALVSGYPESITREAEAAIDAIQGNFLQYLLDVIRKNPPSEKLAAFNIASNNKKFTDAERAGAALVALEMGLNFFAGNKKDEDAAANLRYAAARTIKSLRWIGATGLAIKHFYRVQQDYGSGFAPREQLVEAVACLGATGAPEAAQVLALHLGLMNSRMERNGEYDEAVTLGVIQALGEIGDKIAFDYLLYISYLSYPEGIQNAAKDALNRLKW